MTAATNEPFNWRLILATWIGIVVLLCSASWGQMHSLLTFTDNDDLMRMTMATDLADGQPWQDTFEYRDDTPYGTPMHWSRLIDAPIAAAIVVLRPFFGAAARDDAAFFWPPLMLLGIFVVSVGLTRRVLGPGHQVAAVILPLLSLIVLGEFMPGRIDHHNVQMILNGALIWATLSGRSNGNAAIAAGLITATSLAIGLETIPAIVAAIVAFALFWVADANAAANARRFAAALALGTLGHFLLATPPSRYLVPACDAISDTYVVSTLLVAGAVFLATLAATPFGRAGRFMAIGVLGAAAGAISLALFPDCLHGPFGRFDPRAAALIFAQGTEGEPLFVRFLRDPGLGICTASAAVAGLAVIVWCIRRETGDKRTDWLVLALFMVLAAIVMVASSRGARFTVMPAIPAAAWLIAATKQAYLRRAAGRTALAFAASWLVFAGIVQVVAAMFLTELLPSRPAMAASGQFEPTTRDCLAPEAYRSLAALPPGRVMSVMGLGPTILRYTPHSVVSAGYHRNQDGALAVDDFLKGSEATARQVARQRGLDYVVVCPGIGELKLTSYSKPDSFVALLAEHRHWDWLQPISAPHDPIEIFKIDGGH